MFLERLSELIDVKCDGKQTVFAEKTGISQSTISCYFTRGSLPSATQLIKIADVFDVSVDYLLGREDDYGIIHSKTQGSFTLEEKQIIETYRSLSAREKQLFNGIFKSLKND